MAACSRSTSRSVTSGGALGQPVLRRLQRALQPVDRLGEEAVGVARQQVALVDPRHLERHVGPLHARLCFARAQPVRGGLLARRDLAERVQRLDDTEVPHEGGRQVGEPEASVLLLDGLRRRSGDQRGLQRRADAGVQRDDRPAGRVDLAALRLQHGLLGARGGDPGILRQRGAHRRRAGPACGPPRAAPPASRAPGTATFVQAAFITAAPGGAGRDSARRRSAALVRVAEGVSAEQIGDVQGRLGVGDALAGRQIPIGAAGGERDVRLAQQPGGGDGGDGVRREQDLAIDRQLDLREVVDQPDRLHASDGHARHLHGRAQLEVADIREAGQQAVAVAGDGA